MSETSENDADLFARALPLPPEQRAVFLARACHGNSALRQRVEKLLQFHDQAGDFLENPPPEAAFETSPNAVAGEKLGSRIGHYKLLQKIGEGGCGIVYMAEQEEPVRRRVALKIIKPGLDTNNALARFEAERQALALMDHPGIAKVFDAGATPSGRPYFVMELVRGTKITDYCDQSALTTEERLDLFVQVCRAVQHAHQKGIIHRDIKPSNILVTRNIEGEAMPVIIDFGIAKATSNQRLTNKTLFTAFEMFIGTPAYMSPEQAELSGIDVDTRTDIYSLGVLLYELLTGSTPLDSASLLKAGIDEIRRTIREKEPQRPSTRLSTLTAANLRVAAEHRRSAAPALIRFIRGDLDWIVMKSLEKDRTRRYETATGLALDVQRFLADEPIAARPPNSLYKLRKTVQRHKLLFAGLCIIAALLVASLAVISVALGREKAARVKAQTEEFKSRQVTQFLKDMLRGVKPSVARGRDTVMLREILDQTAERIGKEIGAQPQVEAELRNLIGNLYLEIGNFDQAERMQRAALAIYRKLRGPDSPEIANSLNDLGLALWQLGRLSEAETVHLEALEMRRRLFGKSHADVATSLNNLAAVYRRHGKTADAERLTRQALDIRERLFGKSSLEYAEPLRNLGILMGEQGNWQQAEEMTRQVLAIRRQILGNDDTQVASALVDVAWAAGALGKLEEAESLERDALAMRRQLLGDDHPAVAKSLYLVGDRLRQEGRLKEARSYLAQAMAIQRKLLGEDNPAALDTLRSIGLAFESEGLLNEAEITHRKALSLWRKRAEAETPQGIAELDSLVHILINRKELDQAENLLDQSLTSSFINQPGAVRYINLRVELLARQHRWQEAVADAERLVNLDPANSEYYNNLAALLAITHNRAAYDRLLPAILKTFGDATNPYVADKAAKDCLILPPSGLDLRALSHLADTAVMSAEDSSTPFFHVCKALAEYRMAHYREALDWAAKSTNAPQPFARAHAFAISSMAHSQLGESAAARAELDRGDTLAPNGSDTAFPPDLGDGWIGWVFARVTLDEARQLIESPPTSRSAQSPP